MEWLSILIMIIFALYGFIRDKPFWDVRTKNIIREEDKEVK
ncbi:MAG: hypothetical protein ACLFUH_04615 [Bacteroidales bacterium]